MSIVRGRTRLTKRMLRIHTRAGGRHALPRCLVYAISMGVVTLMPLQVTVTLPAGQPVLAPVVQDQNTTPSASAV
jgi:hypothetical protein